MPQRNFGDESEIAATFPTPPPPPPGILRTNGNILGKAMLQDDSPVAGGLRQILFKEKGLGSVSAWPGCSPPTAGRAQLQEARF